MYARYTSGVCFVIFRAIILISGRFNHLYRLSFRQSFAIFLKKTSIFKHILISQVKYFLFTNVRIFVSFFLNCNISKIYANNFLLPEPHLPCYFAP